jgi:putative two-component system response regulator
MQNHTTSGERICSGMRSLAPVLPIIRNHHERWDGTGYPDRLKKDQIPLLARVLQIADIFDALTTERPYKSAFSPDYAIQVLRNEVAAGWRDPAVVEALCDIFPQLEAAEAFSSASLFALSLALGESQVAETNSNAVELASVLGERQSEAETRPSRIIYQR